MVRMNKVLLAGNLTRDPVLRKTSSGVAVADMGLAVTCVGRGEAPPGAVEGQER